MFMAMTAFAVPVTVRVPFLRDQVLGEGADGVEPGLVRRVEEIREGGDDVLAELGLADGCKTSVRAKALRKALHRRERQDLLELVKILPYAAVQRLSQCLGAYGRLASVGQPQFQKYVVPALQNLLDAADKAGLDAIGALAEDLIAKSQHAHHH